MAVPWIALTSTALATAGSVGLKWSQSATEEQRAAADQLVGRCLGELWRGVVSPRPATEGRSSESAQTAPVETTPQTDERSRHRRETWTEFFFVSQR